MIKTLFASAGVGFTLLFAAFLASANDVEALLKSEMQLHHVSGLACWIIEDGKPITEFYAGSANLEWPSPVDADTEFEIGSVSKQFAAAATLLLVDQKKLSLNDRIFKFLTNCPAAWTNITVRELLSHTSGIPNYDGLDGFEMRQHLTQARFIHRIGAYPLKFPPGTRWSYCNTGFNLVGYIVENVSKQNYWDFLRQHIFAPLQMTNTTRRDPWLVIPHRASGYVYQNDAHFGRDSDLTDLFAAGAIVSTVSDLAKWDAALMGTNFLNEATKKIWWTPARLNNGADVQTVRHGVPSSYGFGWFISSVNGHSNIGHTGITSGFSAANELFPNDHLTIIILSNTDEGTFAGDLAYKVAQTLLPTIHNQN